MKAVVDHCHSSVLYSASTSVVILRHVPKISKLGSSTMHLRHENLYLQPSKKPLHPSVYVQQILGCSKRCNFAVLHVQDAVEFVNVFKPMHDAQYGAVQLKQHIVYEIICVDVYIGRRFVTQ